MTGSERKQIGKTINILKRTAVNKAKSNIAAGLACTLCTNHMRSDTGCDGSCQYDQRTYEKIMKLIEGA